MFRHAPQLSLRFSSTFKRHLATKHHFLVLLNDFPGSLAKRFGRRPEHLLKAHQNSAIRVGGKISQILSPLTLGPLYSKMPTLAEPEPVKGSVIIVEAESREDVINLLKEDVYYEEGVWDVDNVAIIPMKVSIMRAALADKNALWAKDSLDGGNQATPMGNGKQIS